MYCCVRKLLILARTWFAFGLPSKTGCDTPPTGEEQVVEEEPSNTEAYDLI
jgi:hypothetical protein